MLDLKKTYLQIALNGSLSDSLRIIGNIPLDDRIIIELGTPFIKTYGVEGMRQIVNRLEMSAFLSKSLLKPTASLKRPYIVADMKCIDRGELEVQIAYSGKASAATVMGTAPTETIDTFIETCKKYNMDAMIDMMNVVQPYQVLRKLKALPSTVILHRGVDEEQNSLKVLPIHMINKIKGAYNIGVAIAGGDKEREIQSAVFNGANIVVVWKEFMINSDRTNQVIQNFLTKIK